MVIYKRLLRFLKRDFSRYLLIFLVVALGMGMVVAFASASDSVQYTIDKYEKDSIEDGNFTMANRLKTEEIDCIKKMGYKLEESFYYDIDLENESTLRAYKLRKDIDVVHIDEGNEPSKNDELVLEKVYAEYYHFGIDDILSLEGKQYRITGIGSSPDYCFRLRNVNDLGMEDNFGLAWMTEEGIRNLNIDEKASIKNYSYLLNDAKDDRQLREFLLKYSSFENASVENVLLDFLEKDDNQRIDTGKDDVIITKMVAIIADVIVSILIGYILSVFAVQCVQNDSKAIGTLLAMGYKKNQLIINYLILPVGIVTIASIIGTVAGFYVAPNVIGGTQFSYPDLEIIRPKYLYFLGVGIPVFFVLIVNLLVLNNKLSKNPISLIRKTEKSQKNVNINVKSKNFVVVFWMKHIVKELSSNILMFCGLFISILLMIMGFSIHGSINNFVDHIVDDVNYEYMYVIKTPINDDSVGENKTALIKNFRTDFNLTGKQMNVSVMGIKADNKFFDFADKLTSNENEIVMSSAARIKFGYSIGDKIILQDILTEKYFAYEIIDEVEYGYGIYFFMSLPDMQKSLGYNEEYYNTIFSNEKIDIDKDNVVSEISKSSIINATSNWVTRMRPTIIGLVVVSVLIFIMVMYLLMKIMIEKSTSNISLFKIMGYNQKELCLMYLGSESFVVLFSIIVSVPLGKFIMNYIYPYFVSHTNSGMDCFISIKIYICIILIISAAYLLSVLLIILKINKVNQSEILKNRE